MKSSLSADRVLHDIEFEIIQGAISQDDLGQGIQAVRRFQNKTRTEVLEAGRRATPTGEIAARQFQINDMLITLLQEMAARLQQLQVELRKTVYLAPDAPPASPPREESVPAERAGRPAATSQPTSVGLERPDWQPPADVKAALRAGALRVEPEVRPVRFPLIGGLLTRLRGALHSLSLFYVQRLASRQVTVNAALGEWILHLERLHRLQQEQIEALNAQLAALQARPTDDKAD